MDEKYPKKRCRRPSFWEWNPCDAKTFAIWGHRIGTVSSCSKFRTTMDDYLESERENHLENLKSALLLAHGHMITPPVFATSMLEPSRELSLPDEQIVQWLSVLRDLRKKSLPETITMLKNGSSWTPFTRLIRRLLRRPTRCTLMSTQIAVCKYMAENRQMVLSFKVESPVLFPRNSGRDIEGICTSDVQVGDKVVLFSGLSSLLIVRGESHATQLVCPIRMSALYHPGTKAERDFRFSKEQQEKFTLI
ncbi:MAG: hypothetical protein Q9160_003788 [Pyrenula sp. 1 TL-2023]